VADPEKKVDAEAIIEADKAKKAERKRFKEEFALADEGPSKTTILEYPIDVSTGVASFPKDGRPKAKKEPLDEALINEILGEQQTKGNGQGFTFKDAEEPKDEGEEASLAVQELGVVEVNRRRLIRRLKLQEINDRYAVIRAYGGKCVVVAQGRSPINPDKKVFVIQSLEAFVQWKANDFIPSLTKAKERQAVGPWWWRHPKRRQFDGVVFEPLAPEIVKTSDGKSLFNTYLGWGVKPKQGDWSLIRRHIREVLANNDLKTDDYIIRWTAWSIQHPNLLPLVALVLDWSQRPWQGNIREGVGNNLWRSFTPDFKSAAHRWKLQCTS
jgi:hypothetical protein